MQFPVLHTALTYDHVASYTVANPGKAYTSFYVVKLKI